MDNKDRAKHQLARTTEHDEIHVTTDGQCFFQKHQAEAHQQRFGGKKLETFSRADVGLKEIAKTVITATNTEGATTNTEAKTQTILDGSNKDVKAAVEDINDLDELTALLELEKNGEDRKGAKNAIADRIEAVKAEIAEAAKDITVEAEEVTTEEGEGTEEVTE